MEVSTVRRVLMYYGNREINPCLSKCPLNGRCPLSRMSVNRGVCHAMCVLGVLNMYKS